MSQKPFEHIDDQFREAAQNFQPPFNREGWDKMERLLEKSGRKRRPIFWFWPLLLILITGGAGVYIFKDADPKNTISDNNAINIVKKATEKNQVRVAEKRASSADKRVNKPDQRLASSPENSNATAEQRTPAQTPVENGKETAVEKPQPVIQPPKNFNRSDQPLNTSKAKASRTTPVRKGIIKRKNAVDRNLVERGSAKKITSGTLQPTLNEDMKQPSGTVKHDVKRRPDETQQQGTADTEEKETSSTNKEAEPKNHNDVDGVQPPKDSAANRLQSPDSAHLDQSTKKPKKQTPSGLYYTLSLAADGNALKPVSVDQLTLRYGLGIGYQFNRRWSVRTGIFGSQKNYTASDKDYYFKPGSYYDTVDMKGIAAACYVIEIPIAARYNFIQKKQSSFYSVVGLSSYIMKKEVYDYYYTYHNTWPATPKVSTHTYTGNKHFFSVLDLSIGYERKLTPMFSLQAEPYVKIPLAGVGAGKVHLYSTGLQLSFKWQRMKTFKDVSR